MANAKDNFIFISSDMQSTTCCNPEGFAMNGYSNCCGASGGFGIDGKVTGEGARNETITKTKSSSTSNTGSANNKLGDLSKNLTPDEIQAGVETAGAIATAFANRQKSALKTACGRKPLVGKAKKDAYRVCVANFNMPPIPPDTGRVSDNGMSTGAKWGLGIGGALLFGAIVFAVVKSKSVSATPKISGQ